MFTLCGPVSVDTARLKADGGLFGNILHAVLAAANAVPQFRHRIRVDESGEWIAEHAQVDCTCTIAGDAGAFSFGSFAFEPDRRAFLDRLPARVAAAAAHQGLDLSQQGRDDLLYLSSVPWRELSAVQHAMAGDPLESIPRILWGRVSEGRLTVCVTAHHALVDGFHAAQLLAEIEARLG